IASISSTATRRLRLARRFRLRRWWFASSAWQCRASVRCRFSERGSPNRQVNIVRAGPEAGAPSRRADREIGVPRFSAVLSSNFVACCEDFPANVVARASRPCVFGAVDTLVETHGRDARATKLSALLWLRLRRVVPLHFFKLQRQDFFNFCSTKNSPRFQIITAWQKH